MWNLAPRLYDRVEGDPVFKLEDHITKPMPKSHQVLLELVRTVPYNSHNNNQTLNSHLVLNSKLGNDAVSRGSFY